MCGECGQRAGTKATTPWHHARLHPPPGTRPANHWRNTSCTATQRNSYAAADRPNVRLDPADGVGKLCVAGCVAGLRQEQPCGSVASRGSTLGAPQPCLPSGSSPRLPLWRLPESGATRRARRQATPPAEGPATPDGGRPRCRPAQSRHNSVPNDTDAHCGVDDWQSTQTCNARLPNKKDHGDAT